MDKCSGCKCTAEVVGRCKRKKLTLKERIINYIENKLDKWLM